MINLKYPSFNPGTVWLVGAGPGDPMLLSLLALHALEEADIVVHDALIDPRILELIKCPTLNFGKRGGLPSPKQEEINQKLIELAKQNLKVARLKGGDPFVFGRGAEEAQTLIEAGINFKVVPGITSGTGGLSWAGIPPTTIDQQVISFITGHDSSGNLSRLDWSALASGSHVLVFYMAMRHAQEIADNLIAAGRKKDEPAAIVSKATTCQEKTIITTLEKIGEAATALSPPGLLVIGSNVALHKILQKGMK